MLHPPNSLACIGRGTALTLILADLEAPARGRRRLVRGRRTRRASLSAEGGANPLDEVAEALAVRARLEVRKGGFVGAPVSGACEPLTISRDSTFIP